MAGKKKKRAPWGSKKRAQAEAAYAAAAAAEAAEDGAASAEEPAAQSGVTNGHGTQPAVGDAIENVKNWLAPFDVPTRKQIMKAVGVFLK